MKCDNCPWPEITECYGINMPEYNFEKNELEKIIKEAFKSFEKEDYYLVVHKINEVAIVAGFYFHIRQLVQKYYPELNVDIEYDKNGDSRKRYGNEHYARPDLIIHKRGCNKYNILYMEFKKIDNDRRIIDYKKLEEFKKKLVIEKMLTNIVMECLLKLKKMVLILFGILMGSKMVI